MQQAESSEYKLLCDELMPFSAGGDSFAFYTAFWRHSSGLNLDQRREIIDRVKALKPVEPKECARLLLMEGIYFVYVADFDKALSAVTEAANLFTGIDDKGGQVAAYTLTSICYRSTGQLDKAQNAIKNSLRLMDHVSVSDCLGFFLTVTCYQAAELNVEFKNYDKAIEYYNKGMQFKAVSPDLEGRLLTGLGAVWLQMKEYEKSIKAYTAALDSMKGVNNPLLESKVYSDIGNYYLVTKDYESALQSIEISLGIRIKNNYLNPAITNYVQLATLCYNMQSFEKAIFYGEKAVEEAKKFKVLIKEFEAHEVLSRIYEECGERGKALEHFKRFHQLKEEVHNQEVMRRVEQINSRHKVEVMEHEKEIFRLRNVELKSALDEIKESIRYAKRIQTAILPSDKLISTWLPESFILYQPRDIVAGDFYWMNVQDGTILIAACDCTGHGVPGAMVSVVCHNALNRVVNEFKKTVPGEILDKTCDLVIETFTSFGDVHEEDVKDGMDISLCAIKGNKLLYSGANNSLWIIRKGKLTEIKASKQPVGRHLERKPFETHEVEMQPGDMVYLFSDGFADQFGGEKGKKFSSARMKGLLLRYSNEEPAVQKENIAAAFNDWKGSLEQVDDVLLIGIRF